MFVAQELRYYEVVAPDYLDLRNRSAVVRPEERYCLLERRHLHADPNAKLAPLARTGSVLPEELNYKLREKQLQRVVFKNILIVRKRLLNLHVNLLN